MPANVSPDNHSRPRHAAIRELSARLRAQPFLKAIGISAFITVFFVGYFYVLKNPAFTVTTMPLIGIDHLIPFQPLALLLYVSLWFYVTIPPMLYRAQNELITYGAAAGALAVSGLIIFFFWPTSVPPLEIEWDRHPGFAFLKKLDAAGNACPSLHVAFAVFTALAIHHLLRAMNAHRFLRWINAIWCLGILYSTLATKQHVAVDVFVGAALGWAFGSLCARAMRRGSAVKA